MNNGMILFILFIDHLQDIFKKTLHKKIMKNLCSINAIQNANTTFIPSMFKKVCLRIPILFVIEN